MSDEEAARLAEAAAAEALRRRLSDLQSQFDQSQADQVAAQRKEELLNGQVLALRTQISRLQALLDASKAVSDRSDKQVAALGAQLNVALARLAAEERQRAQQEEELHKQLEGGSASTDRFLSGLFARVTERLESAKGVRVLDDRLLLSSETLYGPGSVSLSREGKALIAAVAETMRASVEDFPSDIDWVLQIEGHTDNVPVSGSREYKDNWDLSLSRSVAVVRYLVDDLGFPPNRVAAAGFGEHAPLDPRNTAEARALNRRIELRLTRR